MQVCATPSAQFPHIRKNARDSTLQRSASDFRLQTSDWESGIKSRKAAVAGRWPCHSLALSTAPTALLTLYKLGDFYLMPYSEYTSYVDTLALFLCRTSKAKSEEVKCSWYVDYDMNMSRLGHCCFNFSVNSGTDLKRSARNLSISDVLQRLRRVSQESIF